MKLILGKKHIVTLAFVLGAMVNSYSLFGNCSQANLALTGFQLRDQNGNVFTNTDNYILGQQVTGELWFFLGGSSTNGFNMRFFFDVIVNGVLTQDDQFECMFPGTALVKNQWVKVRNFSWKWGDIIQIQDIFAYWDTNGNASTCGTNTKNNINAQCYSNPSGFAAVVPLFPNFIFSDPPCDSNTVTFTNQTTGGTPPYTYSWNFGGQGTSTQPNPTTQTNPIYTYSQPGTYSVSLTATDNLAPNKTTTTFTKTVVIPSPIALTAVSSLTLFNGSTGSIDLTVSGGTPPFSYSWTGPNGFTSTSEDISSLSKGNYSVEVTDSKGCKRTAQFFVNDLTPDFSFVECNSEVSFTNLTAGGTLPYSYTWNFGGAGSSTQSNPTTQASPIFTYSQPGTYTVSLSVTDNLSPNNTTASVTKTVVVLNPIALSSETSPSLFNGSTGNINLTVTGGALPYSYSWTGPNSFTSTSKDISSLRKGEYQVTVTDARGCIQTASYLINDILTPDFSYSSVLCNTRIQFTNTTEGGSPPFNYSYSWDFNNDGIFDSNSANPIYNFPSPGTYPISLTVNDGTTTTTITKEIFIDPNFGIQVTIFPTKKNEESGEIYVENVTGGTPPYTYYWTGPDGFISTNKDIFNLKDGLYRLVVTDANGCQQTEQYTMDVASVLNLAWKSFDLVSQNNKIKINWEMTSEVVNVQYDIQRSLGNITDFVTIATILGQKTTTGESKYEFEDLSVPRTHERIYYRILRRMHGALDYSSVKMIELPLLANREVWMVYPNPSAGGHFNLNFKDLAVPSESLVTLELFNSSHFFRSESLRIKSGQTIRLQEVFGALPKGILILRIQDGSQVKIMKLINEN
jgi:PKD repeat protein